MIVAIDGPAGAGKSSVAQAVAARLHLQYIDTGAIYRTLALLARERDIDWQDGDALADLAARLHLRFSIQHNVNTVTAHLDGHDRDVTDAIRAPDISLGASTVAAHPPVRAALLELQRRLGHGAPSLLEGRDIGTVVFPDAQVKIYLTASPETRAQRRHDQLCEKAADPAAIPTVATIAAEIRDRDARDASRPVAPLRPAHDATQVDTTGVPFEEVVDHLVALVQRLTPP
jgi:cytidylate kinase